MYRCSGGKTLKMCNIKDKTSGQYFGKCCFVFYMQPRPNCSLKACAKRQNWTELNRNASSVALHGLYKADNVQFICVALTRLYCTCIQLVLATLPRTQYKVRILSTAKMFCATDRRNGRGLSVITWPRRSHAVARWRCLCLWTRITDVMSILPAQLSDDSCHKHSSSASYRGLLRPK